MKTYRITTKKWASTLQGSGYASRWNSSGKFVIYSAENRSLACLENLVHRNGFGLNADFCMSTILIPDDIIIMLLTVDDLPKNWDDLSEVGHLICRDFGDKWLDSQKATVLIVPSVIIKNEQNILLNPSHQDFKKIKIVATDNFLFDERFSI